MIEYVVLGLAGIALALVGRYVFGITPFRIAYLAAHRVPMLGQMMHDTAIAKHVATFHSKPAMHDAGSFVIRSVPFMEDNYAYLLVDKETGRTAVVDAGDAGRVMEHLREVQVLWDHAAAATAGGTSSGSGSGSGSGGEGMPYHATFFSDVKVRPELTTILTTHYHFDHAGGNRDLVARYPELRVVGSAKETVPHANVAAAAGVKLWLGRTEVDVLSTPCHTRGHVMYYVHGPPAGRRPAAVAPVDEDGGVAGVPAGAPSTMATTASGRPTSERVHAGSGALFTGDTLFVGGVGKFFEGTAEDMYHVLYMQLRAIPPETPIFCGHEYTVDNLKFALWLDRGNKFVEEKLAWAMRRRSQGHSTVPTLLLEERQHNPFLRVHIPAVKAAVAAASKDARGGDMPEVPVLAAMRALKDAKAHLASGGGGMAPPASAPAGRPGRHEDEHVVPAAAT